MAADVEKCSQCKTRMEPEDPARQSAEQRWCGKWFRCPKCPTSRLVMSEELKAFHAEQAARAEARAKVQTLF